MVSGSRLATDWPEIIALILLIAGFTLSISIPSTAINYTIVVLAGLMGGRLIYEKKGKQPMYPFFLIIIGFIVGYALGNYESSMITTALLFIVAGLISHTISKRKIFS